MPVPGVQATDDAHLGPRVRFPQARPSDRLPGQADLAAWAKTASGQPCRTGDRKPVQREAAAGPPVTRGKRGGEVGD